MKKTKLDDKIVYEFLKEAPEDEEPTETEEPEAAPTDTAETEESDETEDEAEEEIDWEEGDDEEEESVPVVDNTSLLDAEIDAVLIDFESKAMFNQDSEESEIQEEGYLYESGITLLLEDEESPIEIDVEVFSADVARLVKNYDNLLDMEALLVKKAERFISDKHGEEAAQKFIDSLDNTHGISFKSSSEEDSEISTPLAVGATADGAAAT